MMILDSGLLLWSTL